MGSFIQFLCQKSAFSAVLCCPQLENKVRYSNLHIWIRKFLLQSFRIRYTLQRSEPPLIIAIEISKKTVKIPISDQIAFAAVVYFGQLFVFCWLINKSVLVSTNNVQITCTISRSTLSRNHPTLHLIKMRKKNSQENTC